MIFTPVESAKALEVLNDKCSVQFEDCSYKNDVTDSVMYTNRQLTIIVGFPNVFGRKPEHEEEFDLYNVFVEYGYDTCERKYLTVDDNDLMSLDDVIKCINSYLNDKLEKLINRLTKLGYKETRDLAQHSDTIQDFISTLEFDIEEREKAILIAQEIINEK
jgi:hypothetical protein